MRPELNWHENIDARSFAAARAMGADVYIDGSFIVVNEIRLSTSKMALTHGEINFIFINDYESFLLIIDGFVFLQFVKYETSFLIRGVLNLILHYPRIRGEIACIDLGNIVSGDIRNIFVLGGDSDCIRALTSLKIIQEAKSISIRQCHFRLSDINPVNNLRSLSLYFCRMLDGFNGVLFENLVHLKIKSCTMDAYATDFSNISSCMRSLKSFECTGTLQEITRDEIEIPITNLLSRIGKIKTLRLQWLNEINASILSDLVDLRALHIIACSFSEISCLDKLSRLEVLKIDQTSGIDSFEFLRSMTKLKILIIPSSEVRFSHISNLTLLRKVDFSGCINLDTNDFLLFSKMKDIDISWGRINKDLSFLKKMHEIRHLDISGLLNISSISFPTAKLESINLSECENLIDLGDIFDARNIKSINISFCHKVKDISKLESLKKLEFLDLSRCSQIEDISPLSSLSNLRYLNLHGLAFLDNIDSLMNLKQIRSIHLNQCARISDISVFNHITEIETLDLSQCDLLRGVNITNLKKLRSLKFNDCKNLELINIKDVWSLNLIETDRCDSLVSIDISKALSMQSMFIRECRSLIEINIEESYLGDLSISSCGEITDLKSINVGSINEISLSRMNKLSSLDGLPTLLRSLSIKECNAINDIKSIATCKHMKSIEMHDINAIESISTLSVLRRLERLNLNGCSKISSILPISSLIRLKSVSLDGLNRISDINPIIGIESIEELSLKGCGEIQSIQKLRGNRNLRKLDWITPSKTSEVLAACALLRNDITYIKEHHTTWLEHIRLIQSPNQFFHDLCNALALLNDHNALSTLAQNAKDFTSAQLDNTAWRHWTHTALKLPPETHLLTLQRALQDLNTLDALEARGAGIIGALGALGAERPEWARALVEETLNSLKDDDQRRAIAAAAAACYAQWGEERLVNLWIDHGTHPEAPLWRDRVLLAIVEVEAARWRWEETRRLLALIETHALRDQAHAAMGARLLGQDPVRAALQHLRPLVDDQLRVELALRIANRCEALADPAAASELLFALQGQPDLLATLLCDLVKTQPDAAQTIKELLAPAAPAAPALDLRGLLEDETWEEFTKKRALREAVEALEALDPSALSAELTRRGLVSLMRARGVVDADDEAALLAALLNAPRETPSGTPRA